MWASPAVPVIPDYMGERPHAISLTPRPTTSHTSASPSAWLRDGHTWSFLDCKGGGLGGAQAPRASTTPYAGCSLLGQECVHIPCPGRWCPHLGRRHTKTPTLNLPGAQTASLLTPAVTFVLLFPSGALLSFSKIGPQWHSTWQAYCESLSQEHDQGPALPVPWSTALPLQ